MVALPKKYARMGFKKGWAAYKRRKSKPNQSTAVTKKMAKRRRYGFKKSYRKAKAALTFGNVTKVLIGAGLAAVYEVYVSPMIPFDGMLKNIVELAGGLMLAATPRMPMAVKAFGAALATINAYALVMSYLPGQQKSSPSDTWG